MRCTCVIGTIIGARLLCYCTLWFLRDVVHWPSVYLLLGMFTKIFINFSELDIRKP